MSGSSGEGLGTSTLGSWTPSVEVAAAARWELAREVLSTCVLAHSQGARKR
jgi:hypothetical protein